LNVTLIDALEEQKDEKLNIGTIVCINSGSFLQDQVEKKTIFVSDLIQIVLTSLGYTGKFHRFIRGTYYPRILWRRNGTNKQALEKI